MEKILQVGPNLGNVRPEEVHKGEIFLNTKKNPNFLTASEVALKSDHDHIKRQLD